MRYKTKSIYIIEDYGRWSFNSAKASPAYGVTRVDLMLGYWPSKRNPSREKSCKRVKCWKLAGAFKCRPMPLQYSPLAAALVFFEKRPDVREVYVSEGFHSPSQALPKFGSSYEAMVRDLVKIEASDILAEETPEMPRERVLDVVLPNCWKFKKYQVSKLKLVLGKWPSEAPKWHRDFNGDPAYVVVDTQSETCNDESDSAEVAALKHIVKTGVDDVYLLTSPWIDNCYASLYLSFMFSPDMKNFQKVYCSKISACNVTMDQTAAKERSSLSDM